MTVYDDAAVENEDPMNIDSCLAWSQHGLRSHPTHTNLPKHYEMERPNPKSAAVMLHFYGKQEEKTIYIFNTQTLHVHEMFMKLACSWDALMQQRLEKSFCLKKIKNYF